MRYSYFKVYLRYTPYSILALQYTAGLPYSSLTLKYSSGLLVWYYHQLQAVFLYYNTTFIKLKICYRTTLSTGENGACDEFSL